MTLYSYWRSTATYQVRIALNDNNTQPDSVSVDLIVGEYRKNAFQPINLHKTLNSYRIVI